MDRTGWTIHQVASADHRAAHADVHDARNERYLAVTDLATLIDDDGGDDEIRQARRRAEASATALAAAEERLTEAEAASAQVVRLTRKQFADRLGIAPDTLSSYVSRGQAPAPDGHDQHGHPWWLQSTTDGYVRPGQGARTDRRVQ